MFEADTAETDGPDEPIVASGHHRADLVVEEGVWFSSAHQTQVHDWQAVDREGGEVLLDRRARVPAARDPR